MTTHTIGRLGLRFLTFLLAAACSSLSLGAEPSAAAQFIKAKTVVLVHGYFADGSSWAEVIRLLQACGINVVSVQNPMASLEGDAEATRRVIDQQPGEVVLVGHSWGGMVITQVGADSKVSSLVYVAAFAPEVGASINDILAPYPAAPWTSTIVADDSGDLTLSQAGFLTYFAPDLAKQKAKQLYAVQGPAFSGTLAQPVTIAAWHYKPSWYVLTTEDQIIAPALQSAMATQIHAKVTPVASGHLAMLSHPERVAEVILEAARRP